MITPKNTGWCKKIFASLPPPDRNENRYYRFCITRVFYSVAMSNIFDTLIMMFIVLNTLVLSLDRYPNMPEDEAHILYICNLFFIVVFTSEVTVKIIGLSLRTFLMDRYNIFDTIVVIFSLVELVIADGENGSKLGALRAIRLFRVFKLFK